MIKFLSPKGDTLSVYTLLEKAKPRLLLMYLWSSFKNPSLLDFKFLNRVKQNYSETEIDIVSIDRYPGFLYTRNEEVDKLEKGFNEKILWHQLIDLRNLSGDGNSYAQNFFKTSKISYLALLDGEGRIIAKDLTQQQAEEKIKEILER